MWSSEFNKGWVIGFIENKGVFTTNKIRIKRKTKSGDKKYQYTNPTFYLVSKDRSALEMAKTILGMGKVRFRGDVFHLEIRKKSEIVRMAEFLEGKLRSESKKQQFERWKVKVLEWKTRAWGQGSVSMTKQFS